MGKQGPTNQDRIIGNNLRKFRLQNDLTQTELAEELNLTFQQVQKYEKGTNRIGGGRIVHICQYLGITTAQLLGADDTQLPSRDEVGILGANPVGVELARAFNRIADSKTRRLLADLAIQLAGNYREVPKAVRPARTEARAGADT